MDEQMNAQEIVSDSDFMDMGDLAPVSQSASGSTFSGFPNQDLGLGMDFNF